MIFFPNLVNVCKCCKNVLKICVCFFKLENLVVIFLDVVTNLTFVLLNNKLWYISLFAASQQDF